MVMGQQVTETEVLIIGAGPGGYVAAIRAAQLGFDVMLVDRAGELGGMCLHHGCIPSKALIHAMNVLTNAKNAKKMGINAECITLDYSRTQVWKQEVIEQLHQGIAGLCDKHGIRVVKAFARFQNPERVILEGEDLEFNAVEFRHCVIATGSRPRELPWAPFGSRILSSKEVLELDHVPESFCVVGGGYIGIELGAMFAKAGSKVSVLEASPTILGAVELELAEVALRHLTGMGIDVHVNTKVESIEERDGHVHVKAGAVELDAEYVLVAIGHVPVSHSLQLDLAGVELDELGFIVIDEQCRTSAKHIFAVGDVTGGVMLAHKASAQGKVAAEVIADKPAAFEPQAIPAVIFSDPEIASVGLREAEAIERYGPVQVGKFPFKALGKALAISQEQGFVKIIASKEGVILGVHAVGPGVTDYISEAALALEMGATAEDLAMTIHPHPTLAESFSEASEALLGVAIHLFQPKGGS